MDDTPEVNIVIDCCSWNTLLYVAGENPRERLQLRVGHLVLGLSSLRGETYLQSWGMSHYYRDSLDQIEMV